MKLIELLGPGHILPQLSATGKKEVLAELVAALGPELKGFTTDQVVEVLLERERLGSTAIGDHIAIPHGKLPHLQGLKLVFGRSTVGVNFDSLDGKPSHLFFLLLAPANSAGLHLKALAKISRMLMSAAFRESLMQAPGAEEITRLLAAKDAET
uniref:PTS sugar transporter subunit IIA n=1 Tax=Desulfobacca acetoxidans TaxID=60893 RepID=A0A7V4G6X1_9BACT